MYLVLDGNSAGPFTLDQVRGMWAEGKVNAQTHFFREGMTEWQPLGSILSELLPAGAPPPTPVPFSPTVNALPPLLVPGFWRRFAGLFIDLVVVGAVGWMLGTALFDTFVAMGQWARLVGFVIAAAYFGILDSKIGGGRTVGKMAMGLKVSDSLGHPLSLGKSLLRASVWLVPYCLNGAVIGSPMSLPTVLVGIVVVTAFFAAAYLLIFNHRTRQNIHDLATNTYCMEKYSYAQPFVLGPLWKGHFIVIGIWFLVLLGMLGLGNALVKSLGLQPLVVLQEKINAVPDVQSSAVVSGVNYANFNGKSSVTHALTITANFIHPVPDVDKAARTIAAIVLADSTAGSPDVISIHIARSYNMGIASGNWVQVVNHRPDEWRKEIGK